MTSSWSANFSPTLLLDEGLDCPAPRRPHRCQVDSPRPRGTVLPHGVGGDEARSVHARSSGIGERSVSRRGIDPAIYAGRSDGIRCSGKGTPPFSVNGAIELGLIARADQRGETEQCGEAKELEPNNVMSRNRPTQQKRPPRYPQVQPCSAAVDLRPHEGEFPETYAMSGTERISSDSELHWWVASDLFASSDGRASARGFRAGLHLLPTILPG